MLWKEVFKSWEPFKSRSTKDRNFEPFSFSRDVWKENGKKIAYYKNIIFFKDDWISGNGHLEEYLNPDMVGKVA